MAYVVMADLFLGDAMDISSDVPDVGNCLVREDVLLASLDRRSYPCSICDKGV